MPTQILASGSGAANSADVLVEPGDSLTVALKDAAGPNVDLQARVDILMKDDAGQYFVVERLTGAKPAVVIAGAGTFRFSRPAGSAACGVFSG